MIKKHTFLITKPAPWDYKWVRVLQMYFGYSITWIQKLIISVCFYFLFLSKGLMAFLDPYFIYQDVAHKKEAAQYPTFSKEGPHFTWWVQKKQSPIRLKRFAFNVKHHQTNKKKISQNKMKTITVKKVRDLDHWIN